ncbi:MAG: T9SS type A sorting domain-containing protein [Bacteroidetes bacterium]|nr:T9SS type A sorting domain-containing protein [Bacteroidota bacterium]
MVDETFSRPPLLSYKVSTEIIDSLGYNTGTMGITDSVSTYLMTAQSGRLCLWAAYYGTDTLIHCRFSWTAPLSGEVSFYAAGVANDGLIGGSRGYVSTDSLVHLKPDNSSALPVTTSEQVIEVYPNPAKNLLQIKTAADEKNLRYSILNINAQTVKTGSTTNGTVSINDLPAGLYWLQCYSAESKMQVVQFVKR